MRSKTIIVLAIIASLLGCNQSHIAPTQDARVTRMDIYYRSFDSRSPVSQSKTDLIRVAPVKISVDAADLIHEFQELLPTQCNRLEGMTANKVDFYLLAKLFSDDGLERESSGLPVSASYMRNVFPEMCVSCLNTIGKL